jgi:hypothetical protein
MAAAALALGSGSAVCGIGLEDRNTALAAPAGASLAFVARNASSFGKVGALKAAFSRRTSVGVRCAGADGVVVAEEATAAAAAVETEIPIEKSERFLFWSPFHFVSFRSG